MHSVAIIHVDFEHRMKVSIILTTASSIFTRVSGVFLEELNTYDSFIYVISWFNRLWHALFL